MVACRKPNVLVIVLDTVRARELPTFGYNYETTPSLSQFATEATVYNRAYTNAPWTLPAHASLFSGLLPSEHGCHGDSPSFTLDAADTLAGRFSEQGYKTYGISNNVWVSDHFGMDIGFDTFHKEWQLFTESQDIGHLAKQTNVGFSDLLPLIFSGNPLTNAVNGLFGKYLYRRHDFGANRTTDHVKSILADTTEPFFLFVNYMEAHAPYTFHEETERFLPTDMDKEEIERLIDISSRSKEYHTGELKLDEDDLRRLQALYDGEIRYLDAQLGRLFNIIDQADLQDTVIMVVGDHGENIGDHSLMAHRFSVHDTLIHVPLLVRYPEWFDAPDCVDVPVDFRDVFTELTSIAEGSKQTQMPSGKRDEPIITEYLNTTYTPEAKDSAVEFTDSEYNHRLAAAITTKHKYVQRDDGQSYLYQYQGGDFETDGKHVKDESVAANLSEYCTSVYRRKTDTNREIKNESVRTHLEDLGYL